MYFAHKVPGEKSNKINIFHYFIVAVKAVLFPLTYSGGEIEAFVLAEVVFLKTHHCITWWPNVYPVSYPGYPSSQKENQAINIPCIDTYLSDRLNIYIFKIM